MFDKTKFDFNDILIQPSVVSNIKSRKDINPLRGHYLPIMASPMDTVVSKENHHLFLENGIIPCLPRGEYLGGPRENIFQSYSLKDFSSILHTYGLYDNGWYLIDIANGHMKKLAETVKRAKEKHPSIKLMVGNVANPETFRILSDAGADFIRVGIGNGGGCLTTENTGVGYPMASLIHECYQVSMSLDNPAKIVADGGMKGYSDIIKALGLGADYVMLGSILNKTLESAGSSYLFKLLELPPHLAERAYLTGLPVYKKFRGMSTKEVQRKWNKDEVKTSEGVIRYRKIEYTIPQWRENFEHYLRSAMSYSNALTLDEFIGFAKFNKITEQAYRRFNK